MKELRRKLLKHSDSCPMRNGIQFNGRVIEEVIEKGADLEHDRWSRWQKYLHSLCVKNEDGTLTIPKERVERWERQIATPYSELSEQEKEYDRIEVRKYQDIFNHIHSLGITQGIEMVEKALPEERKVNYQSLSTGEVRNNVGFNTALSQIKDIIGELKKREHLDSLQTEISKYSIDGKDTILVNFSKGGQVIVSVDPIKTPINELITKLERL